jgi:hypothetical protein
MTDEKLIEAADEYTRRNIGGMQPVTTIGDKVHAAFLAGAVFEKAHAPTVIERHDLVMPIYDEPEPQGERTHEFRDMAAIMGIPPRPESDFDAATHRPLGPEPYSYDCPRCKQDPEDCYCEGPGDEYKYRIVNKFSRRFNVNPELDAPEPQGEPSDVIAVQNVARIIAAAASDWNHNDCGDDDHHLGHSNWGAYIDDARAAFAVFEKTHAPTDDAIRQAKREAWNEADLAHYPLVMAVEQFIDNGGDAWGNLDGPFEQVSALKNPYPKEPEATGGISGFPDITEALDKLTIRGKDHD